MANRVMVFHNKHAILFLLFFCFFSTGLLAKGNQDKIQYTIEDAQELAEQRNYDEAIKILVVIVRNDPEQMEEAQILINDIKKTRDTYNAKYEELITVLFDDENYERSLELIAELEALDANPNETTQDSIREARISAELVYFRQVFNDIMDRGQALLAQKRYIEAIGIYRTGFNLYRRTFDETDYGNIIKDPIYQEIDVLNTTIETFLAEVRTVDQNLDRAITIWESSTPDEITRQTATVENTINRFSNYSQQVYDAGLLFNRQNIRIQNLGEEFREDFFLSFLELIINGRQTVEWREGISTAMNLYWEDQLLALLETSSSRTDIYWQNGLAAYRNEEWDNAREYFLTASVLSRETEQMAGLVRSSIRIDEDTFATDEQSLDIMNRFSPYFEYGRFTGKASDAFVVYCDIQLTLDELDQVDRNDYDALLNVAVTLNNGLGNIDTIQGNWNTYSTGSLINPTVKNSPVPPLANEVLASADQLEKDYLAYRSDIITALAQLDLAPLNQEYLRLNQEYQRVQEYIQGLNSDEQLVKYPRRGLAIIDALEPATDDLIETLVAYSQQYEVEAASLQDRQRIDSFLEQAEIMIGELSTWAPNMVTYRNQAQDSIYEAESRLAEADLYYRDSQQSLNRNEFELSEEQKDQAYTLYLEALNYDADVLDSDEMEERIVALSRAIFNDWNQYVLISVRDLLGDGRTLYYQGSFTRSESVLLEAQRLWAQTNADENQEITRWLNLVNNALSANYGRTITETDPLYGEVNQLLNLAYLHYNNGKGFMDRGNVTDGLKELDQSDRYINQVIDILPINQEASILNLQVEYARDPDVASRIFREMYNGALEKSRSGNQDQLLEALRDLQDLQGVRPDYPGLAATIREIEYELGIRIRPPDPRVLAQSNAKYNDALRIFRTGNRNQYPAALTLLNEALELNPENTAASDLIIEIQIIRGTDNTTVVLSPEDQELFKRAEDLYINGQYFVANNIVDQLLAKGNNNRYPPLIELKRRIQSKI